MDVIQPTQLKWRDLHLLHVHDETKRCAFTRCIACCYKIVRYPRPGMLPNVRPEMCPRMARAKTTSLARNSDFHIGLYDAAQVQRILTIGDGNFSYSLALARVLRPESGVQLVATSHETKTTVVETYPDSEDILNELNAMTNVTVQHEIDATDAKVMKTLGKFDRVIWNFPCVRAPRGKDGQNQEMDMNKKLLHDFFSHVSQILTPRGEVHITHKTKAPFGQWGIDHIAKTNQFRHKLSIVFDRCLYPGYTNKKVLSKDSFPIWDSQTFVFVPENQTHIPPADVAELDDKEESNGPIEKVTMDILEKVYMLLTPTLDDMLHSRKKKRKFTDHKSMLSSSNCTDVVIDKRNNMNQKWKRPATYRSNRSKQTDKNKGHRS